MRWSGQRFVPAALVAAALAGVARLAGMSGTAAAASPGARKPATSAGQAAAKAAALLPLAEVPEVNADIRISDDRRLQVVCEVRLVPRRELSALPFSLNASLAVDSVKEVSGEKLSVTQPDPADPEGFVAVPAKPLAAGQAVTLLIAAAQGPQHEKEKNPLLRSAGEENFLPVGAGGYLPLLRQPPVPTRYKLRFRAPKPLLVYASPSLLRRGEESASTQKSWLYERTAFRSENVAGPEEPTEWASLIPQAGPPTFVYGRYDHLYDDLRWTNPAPLPGGSGTPGPASAKIEILTAPKRLLQAELDSLRDAAGSDPEAGRTGFPLDYFDAGEQPRRVLLAAKNALNVTGHLFGELPLDQLWIHDLGQDAASLHTYGFLRLPLTAPYAEAVRRARCRGAPSCEVSVAEDWVPHAVAHQWAGGLVSFPDPADRWLEEGLAHYAAAFYLEQMVKLEGEGAFEKFLSAERVRLLGPDGKRSSFAAPMSAAGGPDAPPGLVRDLAYAKGAWVLHMLRMLTYEFTGAADEKFLAALREFFRAYAGRSATAADFRAVAEKHAGRSLSGFWKQWVEGIALPRYRVRYWTKTEGGKHTLRVTAQVTGMAADCGQPLPFTAKLPGGKSLSARVPVEAAKKRYDIPVPAKPLSVEFNTYNSVLCAFDELADTQKENEAKRKGRGGGN